MGQDKIDVNELLDPKKVKGVVKQAINGDMLYMWFFEKFNTCGNSFLFTRQGTGDSKTQRYKNFSKLVVFLKETVDSKKQIERDTLLELWKQLLGCAIIYLKSKDARESSNTGDEDYDINSLYEYFETFQSFEFIIYGAKEDSYRDHIYHMLQVFFLGLYILYENDNGGNFNLLIDDDEQKILRKLTIEEKKESRTEEDFMLDKVDEKEKEAMWCIMALTHDLGYAIEALPVINKKIKSMLEKFGNIQYNEISYDLSKLHIPPLALKILSSSLFRENSTIPESNGYSYFSRLQTKFYLKFSNALDKHKHGVISCIILMKNLVYFLESDCSIDKLKAMNNDDAKQFLIRRIILRSIASHDCDDIYYYRFNHFPFFLTLIDEMQEWSRPRFKDHFRNDSERIGYSIQDVSFSEAAVSYTLLVEKDRELRDEKKRNEESESKNEAILKNQHKNILKSFYYKCCKFRKILRSAVDTNKDNTFEFKLIDNIEDDTKKQKIYRFYHVDPSLIEIKLKIDQDDEQELTIQELYKIVKKD